MSVLDILKAFRQVFYERLQSSFDDIDHALVC